MPFLESRLSGIWCIYSYNDGTGEYAALLRLLGRRLRFVSDASRASSTAITNSWRIAGHQLANAAISIRKSWRMGGFIVVYYRQAKSATSLPRAE